MSHTQGFSQFLVVLNCSTLKVKCFKRCLTTDHTLLAIVIIVCFPDKFGKTFAVQTFTALDLHWSKSQRRVIQYSSKLHLSNVKSSTCSIKWWQPQQVSCIAETHSSYAENKWTVFTKIERGTNIQLILKFSIPLASTLHPFHLPQTICIIDF